MSDEPRDPPLWEGPVHFHMSSCQGIKSSGDNRGKAVAPAILVGSEGHCPIVDESLGTDPTLGGMFHDADGPTGHKLRGESEARVMRRIEHRKAGGCDRCQGTGHERVIPSAEATLTSVATAPPGVGIALTPEQEAAARRIDAEAERVIPERLLRDFIERLDAEPVTEHGQGIHDACACLAALLDEQTGEGTQ